MVLPSSSYRLFYALMGRYIEKNIHMGNITVESKYLPILQDHCISEVQRKVADTRSRNS